MQGSWIPAPGALLSFYPSTNYPLRLEGRERRSCERPAVLTHGRIIYTLGFLHARVNGGGLGSRAKGPPPFFSGWHTRSIVREVYIGIKGRSV